MRGVIVALTAALIVGVAAVPVQADPGGRGNDNGDAFRPEFAGPEAATADYKGAKWLAASSRNYTNADRPKSDPIRKVVIHTMQGSYEGTKAWFRNPDSEVTTHYVIRSSDGEITQMVHNADIAWHAGNWDVNVESIGIEHEGYVENPGKWYTDTMYKASAQLVRWICAKYGIPMDRKHIIGHSEVPGADHTDPGSGWDWKKYMKLLNETAVAPIMVDNSTAGRVQVSSSWKTAEADGDYRADHAYNTPVARSDPLWYEAVVPARGEYRVDVWYPQDEVNNDRTPYIVNTSGDYVSVYVDQREGGGSWRSIGVFDLAAGDYPVVGVSRWTGGQGRIVADAVRLVKQ